MGGLIDYLKKQSEQGSQLDTLSARTGGFAPPGYKGFVLSPKEILYRDNEKKAAEQGVLEKIMNTAYNSLYNGVTGAILGIPMAVEGVADYADSFANPYKPQENSFAKMYEEWKKGFQKWAGTEIYQSANQSDWAKLGHTVLSGVGSAGEFAIPIGVWGKGASLATSALGLSRNVAKIGTTVTASAYEAALNTYETDKKLDNDYKERRKQELIAQGWDEKSAEESAKQEVIALQSDPKYNQEKNKILQANYTTSLLVNMLDYIPISRMIGGPNSGFSKRFSNLGNYYTVKQTAKRVGKEAASEVFEEVTPEIATILASEASDTFATKNLAEQDHGSFASRVWDKVWSKDMLYTAIGGAVGGITMAGISSIPNAINDFKDYKKAKEFYSKQEKNPLETFEKFGTYVDQQKRYEDALASGDIKEANKIKQESEDNYWYDVAVNGRLGKVRNYVKRLAEGKFIDLDRTEFASEKGQVDDDVWDKEKLAVVENAKEQLKYIDRLDQEVESRKEDIERYRGNNEIQQIIKDDIFQSLTTKNTLSSIVDLKADLAKSIKNYSDIPLEEKINTLLDEAIESSGFDPILDFIRNEKSLKKKLDYLNTSKEELSSKVPNFGNYNPIKGKLYQSSAEKTLRQFVKEKSNTPSYNLIKNKEDRLQFLENEYSNINSKTQEPLKDKIAKKLYTQQQVKKKEQYAEKEKEAKKQSEELEKIKQDLQDKNKKPEEAASEKPQTTKEPIITSPTTPSSQPSSQTASNVTQPEPNLDINEGELEAKLGENKPETEAAENNVKAPIEKTATTVEAVKEKVTKDSPISKVIRATKVNQNVGNKIRKLLYNYLEGGEIKKERIKNFFQDFTDLSSSVCNDELSGISGVDKVSSFLNPVIQAIKEENLPSIVFKKDSERFTYDTDNNIITIPEFLINAAHLFTDGFFSGINEEFLHFTTNGSSKLIPEAKLNKLHKELETYQQFYYRYLKTLIENNLFIVEERENPFTVEDLNTVTEEIKAGNFNSTINKKGHPIVVKINHMTFKLRDLVYPLVNTSEFVAHSLMHDSGVSLLLDRIILEQNDEKNTTVWNKLVDSVVKYFENIFKAVKPKKAISLAEVVKLYFDSFTNYSEKEIENFSNLTELHDNIAQLIEAEDFEEQVKFDPKTLQYTYNGIPVKGDTKEAAANNLQDQAIKANTANVAKQSLPDQYLDDVKFEDYNSPKNFIYQLFELGLSQDSEGKRLKGKGIYSFIISNPNILSYEHSLFTNGDAINPNSTDLIGLISNTIRSVEEGTVGEDFYNGYKQVKDFFDDEESTENQAFVKQLFSNTGNLTELEFGLLTGLIEKFTGDSVTRLVDNNGKINIKVVFRYVNFENKVDINNPIKAGPFPIFLAESEYKDVDGQSIWIPIGIDARSRDANYNLYPFLVTTHLNDEIKTIKSSNRDIFLNLSETQMRDNFLKNVESYQKASDDFIKKVKSLIDSGNDAYIQAEPSLENALKSSPKRSLGHAVSNTEDFSELIDFGIVIPENESSEGTFKRFDGKEEQKVYIFSNDKKSTKPVKGLKLSTPSIYGQNRNAVIIPDYNLFKLINLNKYSIFRNFWGTDQESLNKSVITYLYENYNNPNVKKVLSQFRGYKDFESAQEYQEWANNDNTFLNIDPSKNNEFYYLKEDGSLKSLPIKEAFVKILFHQQIPLSIAASHIKVYPKGNSTYFEGIEGKSYKHYYPITPYFVIDGLSISNEISKNLPEDVKNIKTVEEVQQKPIIEPNNNIPESPFKEEDKDWDNFVDNIFDKNFEEEEDDYWGDVADRQMEEVNAFYASQADMLKQAQVDNVDIGEAESKVKDGDGNEIPVENAIVPVSVDIESLQSYPALKEVATKAGKYTSTPEIFNSIDYSSSVYFCQVYLPLQFSHNNPKLRDLSANERLLVIKDKLVNSLVGKDLSILGFPNVTLDKDNLINLFNDLQQYLADTDKWEKLSGVISQVPIEEEVEEDVNDDTNLDSTGDYFSNDRATQGELPLDKSLNTFLSSLPNLHGEDRSVYLLKEVNPLLRSLVAQSNGNIETFKTLLEQRKKTNGIINSLVNALELYPKYILSEDEIEVAKNKIITQIINHFITIKTDYIQIVSDDTSGSKVLTVNHTDEYAPIYKKIKDNIEKADDRLKIYEVLASKDGIAFISTKEFEILFNIYSNNIDFVGFKNKLRENQEKCKEIVEKVKEFLKWHLVGGMQGGVMIPPDTFENQSNKLSSLVAFYHNYLPLEGSSSIRVSDKTMQKYILPSSMLSGPIESDLKFTQEQINEGFNDIVEEVKQGDFSFSLGYSKNKREIPQDKMSKTQKHRYQLELFLDIIFKNRVNSHYFVSTLTHSDKSTRPLIKTRVVQTPKKFKQAIFAPVFLETNRIRKYMQSSDFVRDDNGNTVDNSKQYPTNFKDRGKFLMTPFLENPENKNLKDALIKGDKQYIENGEEKTTIEELKKLLFSNILDQLVELNDYYEGYIKPSQIEDFKRHFQEPTDEFINFIGRENIPFNPDILYVLYPYLINTNNGILKSIVHEGDIAFTAKKNIQSTYIETVKRAAGSIGNGAASTINISNSFLEFLRKEEKTKGYETLFTLKDVHDDQSIMYKTITLKDVTVRDIIDKGTEPGSEGEYALFQLENTIQLLKEEGKITTEEEEKTTREELLNMSATDAAGYMTPEAYLQTLVARGKIDEESAKELYILDKNGDIEGLKNLLAKLNISFSVHKPVVNSSIVTNNSPSRFYCKNSESCLWRSLFPSSSPLGMLRESLLKNGVARASYDTAIKVGRVPNNEYSFEEVANPEFEKRGYYEIPLKDYRSQIDAPDKGKEESKEAIQMGTIAFESLLDNEKISALDNKNLNTKVVKDNFHLLRGAVRFRSFNKLRKKFGISDDTLQPPNYVAIIDYLIDKYKTSNNQNIVNYLEAIKKSGNFNLFKFSPYYKAFLSKLGSIVNKPLQLKLKGFSGIQVPSIYALENSNISWVDGKPRKVLAYKRTIYRVIENGQEKWFYGDPKLGQEIPADSPYISAYYTQESFGIQVEEGVTKFVHPPQIVVPPYLKYKGKYVDTASLLEDAKTDPTVLELFQIYGLRIPVGSTSYGTAFEVVGILPKTVHTQVFIPWEVAVYMGADYDVDKLIFYSHSYYGGADKDNIKSAAHSLKELGLRLDSPELKEYLTHLVNETLDKKTIEKYRAIHEVLKDNKNLNALLLKYYISSSLIEGHHSRQLLIEEKQIFKNLAEAKYNELTTNKEKEYPFYSILTQVNLSDQNDAGKDGVGPAALFRSFVYKGQQANQSIYFNGKYYKLFSKTYENTKKLIKDILDYSVDNAKDPILGKININKNTEIMALTLASMDFGLSYEEHLKYIIDFVTSPKCLEFSNLLEDFNNENLPDYLLVERLELALTNVGAIDTKNPLGLKLVSFIKYNKETDGNVDPKTIIQLYKDSNSLMQVIQMSNRIDKNDYGSDLNYIMNNVDKYSKELKNNILFNQVLSTTHGKESFNMFKKVSSFFHKVLNSELLDKIESDSISKEDIISYGIDYLHFIAVKKVLQDRYPGVKQRDFVVHTLNNLVKYQKYVKELPKKGNKELHYISKFLNSFIVSTDVADGFPTLFLTESSSQLPLRLYYSMFKGVINGSTQLPENLEFLREFFIDLLLATYSQELKTASNLSPCVVFPYDDVIRELNLTEVLSKDNEVNLENVLNYGLFKAIEEKYSKKGNRFLRPPDKYYSKPNQENENNTVLGSLPLIPSIHTGTPPSYLGTTKDVIDYVKSADLENLLVNFDKLEEKPNEYKRKLLTALTNLEPTYRLVDKQVKELAVLFKNDPTNITLADALSEKTAERDYYLERITKIKNSIKAFDSAVASNLMLRALHTAVDVESLYKDYVLGNIEKTPAVLSNTKLLLEANNDVLKDHILFIDGILNDDTIQLSKASQSNLLSLLDRFENARNAGNKLINLIVKKQTESLNTELKNEFITDSTYLTLEDFNKAFFDPGRTNISVITKYSVGIQQHSSPILQGMYNSWNKLQTFARENIIDFTNQFKSLVSKYESVYGSNYDIFWEKDIKGDATGKLVSEVTPEYTDYIKNNYASYFNYLNSGVGQNEKNIAKYLFNLLQVVKNDFTVSEKAIKQYEADLEVKKLSLEEAYNAGEITDMDYARELSFISSNDPLLTLRQIDAIKAIIDSYPKRDVIYNLLKNAPNWESLMANPAAMQAISELKRAVNLNARGIEIMSLNTKYLETIPKEDFFNFKVYSDQYKAIQSNPLLSEFYQFFLDKMLEIKNIMGADLKTESGIHNDLYIPELPKSTVANIREGNYKGLLTNAEEWFRDLYAIAPSIVDNNSAIDPETGKPYRGIQTYMLTGMMDDNQKSRNLSDILIAFNAAGELYKVKTVAEPILRMSKNIYGDLVDTKTGIAAKNTSMGDVIEMYYDSIIQNEKRKNKKYTVEELASKKKYYTETEKARIKEIDTELEDLNSSLSKIKDELKTIEEDLANNRPVNFVRLSDLKTDKNRLEGRIAFLDTQKASMGKIADKEQMIGGFATLVQLKALGLNLPLAVADFLQNFTSSLIYFSSSMEDMKYYMSGWQETIIELYNGKVASSPKLHTLNKLFGVEQEFGDITKDVDTSLRRDFIETYMGQGPYAPLKFSDKLNKYPVLISVMKQMIAEDKSGNKIIDGNGNPVSYWDTIDSNGNFLYDNVDYSWVTKKYKDIVWRNFGDYDSQNPLMFQQTTMGRVIYMFKRWLASAILARFGTAKPNFITGELVKGRYLSLFAPNDEGLFESNLFDHWKNILMTIVYDSKLSSLAGIQKDSPLSKTDRDNIFRCIGEAGITLSLIMMLQILKAFEPDEEEKKKNMWFFNAVVNSINRLQQELFTFNIGIFTAFNKANTYEQILPLIKTLKEVNNLFVYSVAEVTQENPKKLRFQSGPKKGRRKSTYYLTQVLPFISQYNIIYNYISPQKRETVIENLNDEWFTNEN